MLLTRDQLFRKREPLMSLWFPTYWRCPVFRELLTMFAQFWINVVLPRQGPQRAEQVQCQKTMSFKSTFLPQSNEDVVTFHKCCIDCFCIPIGRTIKIIPIIICSSGRMNKQKQDPVWIFPWRWRKKLYPLATMRGRVMQNIYCYLIWYSFLWVLECTRILRATSEIYIF